VLPYNAIAIFAGVTVCNTFFLLVRFHRQ
jgi:hypothetical protein